jgi:hypothetical protein
MTIRQIKIEHAPNGFLVTSVHQEFEVSQVLAVFNKMPDLTDWLTQNFQLPVAAEDKGEKV